MLKQINEPLNFKSILKVIGVVFLLVAVGAGVYSGYDWLKNQPWYKKYEIRSYLKKNALRKDFKADFDFDIKTTIANLKYEILNITNQLFLANSNIAYLKDNIIKLKNERNNLQDKLSRLKSKTTSFEEELNAAQRRFTNRQDEVAIARSNVIARTSSVNDLRKQLDSLNQKASAATNEIGKLKNDISRLKDRLSEAKSNQLAVATELKLKTRVVPDSEKNISRLEKELQGIDAEILKTQEAVSNLVAQKSASVANEKAIAGLDRKIQEMNARIESLKTNKSDKAAIIEIEKKKLLEIYGGITNLTNLSTNWQNQVDSLQHEIESLAKTVQTKESELANLKREILNLSQTLTEKENSLKNYAANLQTLETNLFNLKTNIAAIALNAKNTRLEMLKTAQEITAIDRAQQMAQEEINKLTARVDELRKKLRDVQQQLATKEQEEKNQYAMFARNMVRRMNEAASYTALYQIIGEQLWTSDRLLEYEQIDKKQTGIKIAYDAMRCALDYAQNFWLASRITEAYLFPNMNLLKQNEQDKMLLDQILAYGARAFQNADETNGLITAYQLQINNAINENRANYARYYLASIYEQIGDLEKSIYYLKQISDQTNFSYAIRRAEFLQSKLEKLKGKK
jgi:chromosome segregation ATPase